MATEQLDLIEAAETSNPARTAGDLWAIYYPGKTPEQAYNEAREEHNRWYELYKAVQAVIATYHDCRTEEDRAAYWKRLALAETDLRRHDGVPEQWIDRHGHDITPDGICRGCWKPGAIDIDECGGCDHHYHPTCFLAMSVRCDLRSVAFAQMNGDADRASFWMRVAHAKHNESH